MSEEKDIYRDTFFRYFGYAHQFGNHTTGNYRNVFSGITASYIFGDLIQKVNKATIQKEIPKKKKSDPPPKEEGNKFVTESIDVLLWQGIASVMVPSLIGGNVCSFIRRTLEKSCPWRSYSTPTSSIAAILAVLALSQPVDFLTTELLNNTYRPLFNTDNAEKSEGKK